MADELPPPPRFRIARTLARASIWAPDAIPDSEGELARDVKRWVLPTIDLALIGGSIFGVTQGMPSFAIVYSTGLSVFAAFAVLTLSVACLIGVSFPRLWVVEFAGKCGLAFVLLLYALSMLFLAVTEPTGRGWVAGVTAAATVTPVWRIVWLGREHRRRNERAR